MKPSSYVSSFYFYKLAQALSGPYTALDAYNAGTIDEKGNVLKSESSIDSFEYLVIKLKKIFEELPYGTTKAKLSNYLATLQMFGEECQLPSDQYNLFLEGYITANINQDISYISLLEDTTTGGGAGGLGVPAGPVENKGSVMGFDPVMALGLQRRKQPKYFNNCEVFEVCPEELISFKSAKQWKEVPDSETKTYLQRFQRRNKSARIGVTSKNPISGDQDLYWITYPSKNFMEEFDFGIVNFLTEKVLPKEQKNYDPENSSDVADVFENMAGKLNPKFTSVSDHASNLEYATRLAAGIHGLFFANKFSKQNYGGQSSHERDFLGALGNVAAKQKSTSDASSEGLSDVIMFGKSGKIHSVDTKHRYDAKSAKGININSVPGLRGTLESYFKKSSSAKSIPSKEFQQHHADIKDQIVADVESQKYPLGLGIYKRGAGMPEYEYGFHGTVIMTPKNREHVTKWVKDRELSPRSAWLETTSSGNIRRFQPSVKELRSSREMKKLTGAPGNVEEHPERLFVTDNMLKHLESRLGDRSAHLMPIIHYHLVRHGLYHPNPEHGDKEFDLD